MDNDDTEFEPTWSPDGSKVAFMRQSTGMPAGEVAGQDLWTVAAAGGSETNLTNTPIAYECCPEYSPDGTKIAFTNSGHTDGNPSGTYDENEIWVMNANGSTQTQLTDLTDEDDTQDLQPTWSPDGSQIAWIKSVAGAQQIWTMDANGSNQEALTTTGYYYSPVWSPDGELIAAQLGNEIVAVDVDAPASVTNLTNNGSVQDEYPSWAPAAASGDEPDTAITQRPDDVIDRRRARYEFESDPPGADFECKLDAKPYKDCTSPKRLRNLSNGTHRFKVRATTGDGTDPTPAKDSFKVKP
jgi:Tol biopolymer transport system component